MGRSCSPKGHDTKVNAVFVVLLCITKGLVHHLIQREHYFHDIRVVKSIHSSVAPLSQRFVGDFRKHKLLFFVGRISRRQLASHFIRRLRCVRGAGFQRGYCASRRLRHRTGDDGNGKRRLRRGSCVGNEDTEGGERSRFPVPTRLLSYGTTRFLFFSSFSFYCPCGGRVFVWFLFSSCSSSLVAFGHPFVRLETHDMTFLRFVSLDATRA
mmetsp:Transcript_5894/g.14023  ORF Transcript_5894/g.14023 Transcript_5894/m.14023 type:complete len:211 (-) Transcript_5894:363-995(-)